MVPKEAAKKMTKAKRQGKPKDYLTSIASLVTILGALMGGGWALYEYFGKAHDDRVTTTLHFQQQYSVAPMADVRSRIETFWSSETMGLFAATSQGDAALSNYVLGRLDADRAALTDTAAMIDFFAGLGACLCAELCNTEIAVQLFGKDAAAFYALNYPYIGRQRQILRDNSYAAGLATVATAYTSGQKAVDKAACTTFK